MALPLRFVIFAMAASALCALLLAASACTGPSTASRGVPPDMVRAAKRFVPATTRGLSLAGYVATAGLGAGVGAARTSSGALPSVGAETFLAAGGLSLGANDRASGKASTEVEVETDS
ncbi:predicted protein [Postia placenta Mad-698-R]|nr:predicted protein [Postia placenta Mad-698-R]